MIYICKDQHKKQIITNTNSQSKNVPFVYLELIFFIKILKTTIKKDIFTNKYAYKCISTTITVHVSSKPNADSHCQIHIFILEPIYLNELMETICCITQIRIV